VKPELAAAAGKFLHVHQHAGPTPYAVQEMGVRYDDVPAEQFDGTMPGAWILPTPSCAWGTHSFAVGADGTLTFASQCWDSSD
jgi:hypothetical protein